MAVQTVPTKGNLMNTKKSLALAKNGYELLDRKRNILIREMMTLIDHANAIQQKIERDSMSEIETERREVQKTIAMVQSMKLSLCGRQLCSMLNRFGEGD